MLLKQLGKHMFYLTLMNGKKRKEKKNSTEKLLQEISYLGNLLF